MKIILSRKGFDSANGGCASPILPDGRTMLSMPIPQKDQEDKLMSNVTFGALNYSDIWDSLDYRHIISHAEKMYCHLDPDIRKEVYRRNNDWKACFGQASAAQTHLAGQHVSVGDIFLFFGWFRATIYDTNGKLKYKKKTPNLHVMYGYLQIGDILSGENARQCKWHPHGQDSYIKGNNAIYVAAERLLNTELPGYGVFDFDKKYVLTAFDEKTGRYLSRSKWDLPEWCKQIDITYHTKESFHEEYFQSAYIGQEFVIENNPNNEKWIRYLTSNKK